MGFLEGKRALITGVASKRSIAWGIAQAMHREGAELAFTYQGDKLKPRVAEMAAQLDSDIVLPLDVADDGQIEDVVKALEERWGRLDILVHAIGFAPREALAGSYLDSVTREAASISHDISAYSFAALAKAARPLFVDGSALLTLSYLGAERAVPGYNIMGPAKASLEAHTRFIAADLGGRGVRANAISAGPIKTLAAAGIKGMRTMLSHAEANAPLRRNVSIEDVGNAAAFLCSDLAAGITGETLYVDAGYHIMGMNAAIED
ncbi:enoyl-ACP reductase [Salinisphaera sp. PC39]|uniref:enoyl-ACP reductase FabI n=1 Tax=Salinisphaera sp. PC39 TaxID=1304156 RepID=UPI003340B3E0